MHLDFTNSLTKKVMPTKWKCLIQLFTISLKSDESTFVVVYVCCVQRKKIQPFFLHHLLQNCFVLCVAFQVGGKAKSLMFIFNDENNFRGFSLRFRWKSFAHVAALQPDEPDQI